MDPDQRPTSEPPAPREGVPVPTFHPPSPRAKTSPARVILLVLLGVAGAAVLLAAAILALGRG
ncbi:MAG TPA: hypothetical protein VE782_10220 [Myxococcaceae bacterium]|jgi:hypothetical protein|nr:hypothetical protein [Myxococcaceae bacterium]